MTKVAILILADDETHGDMGRVTNALVTAQEFQEAGDEVRVIFDGAGTKWVPTLEDPDHQLHALYAAVEESVAGACAYCADAFEVQRDLEESAASLLKDNQGHPSVRDLVQDGYQVITF